MSVLPMSTKQWQDERFGPSVQRTMKWLAVDMLGIAMVVYREFQPVFADLTRVAAGIRDRGASETQPTEENQ